MDNTSRVAQWRQKMRDEGKEPVTVWLSHDRKLRLEDLAATWRATTSEMVEQALDQFQPGTPPRIGNYTDIEQIREVVEVVLGEMLQGRIREAMQEWQPVTVHNGNVTETVRPERPQKTPSAQQYEAEPGHSLVTEPAPQRKGGRPSSPERQQILALLAEHPEGLSAEQIRVYIKAEKALGDTLQGMKRHGVVTTHGRGKALRYLVRQ